MTSRLALPARSARRRGPRLGCLGTVLVSILASLVAGVVAVRAGCTPAVLPAVVTAGAGPAAPAHLFPENKRRAEESTYLTFPEWYIVYSAEEYARWLESNRPSGFPYFRSIGQYWCGYRAAYELTAGRYPFNSGNHLMLVVIGTSYTAEYAIKGAYESTAGRLTEWLGGADTDEDRFGQQVAAEYGAFLNSIPWYRYPFWPRLQQLWTDTPLWGPQPLRKWERRLALSGEYAVKAVYGWLLGLATNTVYDEDYTEILVWAEGVPPPPAGQGTSIRLEQRVDAQSAVLVFPRFTAFRDALLSLPPAEGRLLALAGNDEIMLTVLAQREWRYNLPQGIAVFEQVVLTDPRQKRVAVSTPVTALLEVLAQLRAQGVVVEHVYDY